MSQVVVISAHPDDEILGAGGTLLKHSRAGDEIQWIIVTGISEQQGFSKKRVKQRQQEIAKVAKRLGVSNTFTLEYPTMKLSSVDLPALIEDMSEIFKDKEPEVIYTVNRSDAHSDHRIVFDATMACTKSFRYPSVKKVLMYECLSETEFGAPLPENMFIPNYYVNISGLLQEKIELMKIYKSELHDHPFPRSIENIRALALHRGATAGVEYAEAFQVVKILEK